MNQMSMNKSTKTRNKYDQLNRFETVYEGKTNVDIYLSLIPRIRKIARIHGYAIGVHGSMNRDLDLIAVAWTEQASSAEELVEAVRLDLCGVEGVFNQTAVTDGPTEKPHGRRAWSIILMRGLYVDLSVISPK